LKGKDLAIQPFTVETLGIGHTVNIQDQRSIEKRGAKVPIMRSPHGEQRREARVIDHMVMMLVPSPSDINLRDFIKESEPISVCKEGLLGE